MLHIRIFNFQEPTYYHREYSNDIGPMVGCLEGFEIAKKVALVALPFLSLYKPFSLPISLGMGCVRVFTSINQLIINIHQAGSKEIAFSVLGTTIAVIALYFSVFAHPIGMIITTSQDVILQLHTLILSISQEGDIQAALDSLFKCVNNALYLALLCYGGPVLSIVSLAMQTIILNYSTLKEFDKKNYLEAAINILMSFIRFHQGYSHVKEIAFVPSVPKNPILPGCTWTMRDSINRNDR